MLILNPFIVFILWFLLIMTTIIFFFQLYVLVLDEDTSQGALNFIGFKYFNNKTLVSFVCLGTNLIAQILVLAGNYYLAFFFFSFF